MKYWYNPKLDCYRIANTKPEPWVRLDGTVCEWQEGDNTMITKIIHIGFYEPYTGAWCEGEKEYGFYRESDIEITLKNIKNSLGQRYGAGIECEIVERN